MELTQFKLKELTAKDLSKALSELKDMIRVDSHLYNEIIIQEGRFIDTVNYFNLNITEKSSIDIEKSRIRSSLLSIIDKLKPELLKEKNEKKIWWEMLTFEWERIFEPYIGTNPSIKRLDYLANRRDAVIDSKEITDLKPINFFSSIEYLFLDCPNVKDFSQLSSLKNLIRLKWIIYKKSDLENLSLLKGIKSLSLFSSIEGEIFELQTDSQLELDYLEILCFNSKSLVFLKLFKRVRHLKFFSCKINQIDFQIFDNLQLEILTLKTSFKFELTEKFINKSLRIKKLIIEDRFLSDYANKKDYTYFFSFFPNLEVIKLDNVEFEHRGSLFDRKKDKIILEKILKDIFDSNAKVIDLSDSEGPFTGNIKLETLLEITKQYKDKVLILGETTYDKFVSRHDGLKLTNEWEVEYSDILSVNALKVNNIFIVTPQKLLEKMKNQFKHN